MNEHIGEVRRRRQNLLVVEGKHERNKLFWLIFKCFPEINIDMDDIWIYGTNIYMLYDDIEKEYGSGWAEEGDDIDLPFVISKKKHPNLLHYKEDFTNIILVFDYERHDSNFSKRKIMEMQRCFVDATDMGKLYINYPMIESYQHLKGLPDYDYEERKIPVSLQPGKRYKSLVNNETAIGKIVEFPHRIDDLLKKNYEIIDRDIRKEYCNAILNITDDKEIDNKLQETFQGIISEDLQKTLKYQLKDWLTKLGYVHVGQTYWKYMRGIFKEIIYHNICKANRIQNNQYHIAEDKYKECFEDLDLTEILRIQNDASQDINLGYIWVLNTCIFFVAEYNFALVVE